MVDADFARQVLALLQRRKVKFHGCAPAHISLYADGAAKIWFYGYRRGLPWFGGIKIRGLDLETNIALAKPEALADIIAGEIDQTRSRLDV